MEAQSPKIWLVGPWGIFYLSIEDLSELVSGPQFEWKLVSGVHDHLIVELIVLDEIPLKFHI